MKNSPETLLEPKVQREITDADLFESEQPDLGKEQAKVERAVKSGKFSSLKKLVGGYIIPGILEGGTKFKDIIEGAVDKSGEAVKKAAKLGSKVLTGFIPSGFGAMFAEKAVNLGIDLGTGVGKGLAKASFHTFTLGSFCWLDAMRQHLAVKEATTEIAGVQNKKELAAVSYLDHLKDPEIQADLKQYYELRKELDKLRSKPEKNKAKIEEIAQRIAQFEIIYKDTVDLSVFKSVLEKGQGFLSKNENLVKEMAEGTAAKIVADAEGFFKKKLGRFAGKVKGEWLEAAADNQPGGREKLKEKIAERLFLAMSEEVSDKKVAAEISKINADLKKSFGIYSRYLKATLYSMMGLALHNVDLFKTAEAPAPAPEPGLMADIREVAVNNTLDNFAAAHNMYTNDLSIGRPDMSGFPNLSAEIPDSAYEEISLEELDSDPGLIDVPAAKAAVSEKIGGWREQISEKVNEIEAVKDVKRANRLFQLAKSALKVNFALPILSARLTYNIAKYLAF